MDRATDTPDTPVSPPVDRSDPPYWNGHPRSDPSDAGQSARTERYRQYVLRYLQDADTYSVSLDELVDDLVSAEFPSVDREQLEIQLHHVTLPKLADAGLIEYDPDGNLVRYRDPILIGRRTNLFRN